MIGIVVVTHGKLAEELVNAARTIVGDIPAIAAVSIGWADDMTVARDDIQRALLAVGPGPALVLTDMFGGTPTNVTLPFLSPQVEIVTGVNLPMLIKLTTVREGDLMEVARVIREQGKGAIYVASEVLEKGRVIQRDVRVTNRLGLHARAAARFVQTANRYRSRITLGRDSRAMDGKSILGILLLAAAQGSVLTVTADGDDEQDAVSALADLITGRFGEDA